MVVEAPVLPDGYIGFLQFPWELSLFLFPQMSKAPVMKKYPHRGQALNVTQKKALKRKIKRKIRGFDTVEVQRLIRLRTLYVVPVSRNVHKIRTDR